MLGGIVIRLREDAIQANGRCNGSDDSAMATLLLAHVIDGHFGGIDAAELWMGKWESEWIWCTMFADANVR